MSEHHPMAEWFRKLAHRISHAAGTVWAFMGALVVILIWALTGPLFHFSDTWQLIINTSTTIVTFLMVFLIQNTQNRDAKAIHLKVDELLRVVGPARTKLVNLENMSDEELDHLQRQFEDMGRLPARELVARRQGRKIGAGAPRRPRKD